MSFAYWFAGGGTYYPGLAISLFAIVVLRFSRKRLLSAFARIVAIIGALLVLLSAVPQPFWLYILWTTGFLFSLRDYSSSSKPARHVGRAAFVLCAAATVALAAAEWPYRTMPKLPYKTSGVLYEIGDSLSMGADTIDGNWPALLAKKAGMSVKSFAFGGAKLHTAQSNTKRVESDASLIIVELGGNDLFYDTPYADFASELDAMLNELSRHDAPLVLIELPLPPTYNRFGAAQRRLARKYHAILVPRRVLARVLASPGATVDNLHLSLTGHERLAQVLWDLR